MYKSPVEIAKETLEVISKGDYLSPLGGTVTIRAAIEKAVESSSLISSETPLVGNSKTRLRETKIEVTDETTLEAAKRLVQKDIADDVLALNFANLKTPGGGFLGGVLAQEESLARSSALFPTLMKHLDWYEENRRELDPYYSDDMIYSKEVPVFRNDDGSFLINPYKVSFLTSAAVNVRELKKQCKYDQGMVETVTRKRIGRILETSFHFGHSQLILGAWGCGVFGNEPEMIADLFAVELSEEFRHRFERVVFAIYDKSISKRTLNTFQQRFA